MAVSAAILEIFKVKEWPDLEIWVWGPSRSLRIAPFDRPRMTLLVSHCNYSSILTRRNFVKMFDAGKTRMIGLPYGEKNYDDMRDNICCSILVTQFSV